MRRPPRVTIFSGAPTHLGAADARVDLGSVVMRDARAAVNGERTVTSVPMSLTHSRAWRPGASPSDAVRNLCSAPYPRGRIQFSRGNTNVKKLAPKKPLEHTTPCVMSAAQVRHGLRRLLRVARRLDGDRIQLRSLLPVAGAHLPSSIDTAHDDAWDGKDEKTSVRSVVLGAVREASGDVSARPEGVRAMSRNAAALEAVIARADLATRAEAAFLASASDEPSEAAATSTSSDSSMSTSRAPSRETRLARLRGWRHLKDVLREHPEVAHRISKPRADMMRLVRDAIDSTLAQASTSRLVELGGASSENDEDETGEWLRHASRTTLTARRDRAKRRAEARRIARQDPVTQWTTEAHMIDPDDRTIDDDDDSMHPNRIFYEGRLDATLDSSASKKPDDTPDDILALFREMHAVGCPPNRRMYIRAVRGVARRGMSEKDVNDHPMKNSEPGSERALRLLWMLAHRSRESAEAGLRATPMGLGGVFSFQTAMGVGVRKAGSTGVVGLDGLCEGFGDAICEALLEAASNEGNEGSQTTRAHERALAAMGALTDLGAAPGTRTANDVLVAVCRAFAKNESQNMDVAENIDDAQSIVVTNQRRFRRVMDAALRAERHGSGLESSTWHALIECAERRGTLDDAFDCVLEFHAR